MGHPKGTFQKEEGQKWLLWENAKRQQVDLAHLKCGDMHISMYVELLELYIWHIYGRAPSSEKIFTIERY